MGKHRDLAGILIMVIIGMFIPFAGSIAIVYGFDFTSTADWLKTASTFGYFLFIFGIELLVVYLYFKITNKIAGNKLEKYKPK